MDPKANLEKIEKNYINQFGRFMFSYNVFPSSRAFLYNDIAKKYKKLKFICVSMEENLKIRSDIEMFFAWKSKPLYWRNGGPFKVEQTLDDVLEQIENDKLRNLDIDEELKKELKSILSEAIK